MPVRSITTPSVLSRNTKSLNVKLQNIRSLFRKLAFVETFFVSENVDICFFTESWLNTNISNSMINLPGYDIFRSDRLDKRGGGVAIYYKNLLDVKLLDNFFVSSTYSNFEFSAMQLKTIDSKITFVCFYIPPDSAKCTYTISNVCKVISSLITHTDPFVLLGDFNFPLVDWTTMTSTSCPTQYFLDFCINNCLTQVISSPTRDNNILDLVFCNISATNQLINSSVDCPMTTTCDHNLISLAFTNNILKKKAVLKSVRNFKKGDYTKINNILVNQDWSFLNSDISFQQRYDHFISLLHRTIEAYIPRMTFSTEKKSVKLPNHIKKLLK